VCRGKECNSLSAARRAKKGVEREKRGKARLLSSKSQDDGDNLINNVPEGIKAALIITAHTG
jgi:hypothetical protein